MAFEGVKVAGEGDLMDLMSPSNEGDKVVGNKDNGGLKSYYAPRIYFEATDVLEERYPAQMHLEVKIW